MDDMDVSLYIYIYVCIYDYGIDDVTHLHIPPFAPKRTRGRPVIFHAACRKVSSDEQGSSELMELMECTPGISG